jgi:hypothetical protein
MFMRAKASAENAILNNISINLKANINGGDIRNKTILYEELFPTVCLSMSLRRLKPK